MSIACPKCGLKHRDGVLTCDCGYELTTLSRGQRARGLRSWFREHPFARAGAVGFALGFVGRLLLDAGNPYLTFWQVLGRAAVIGGELLLVVGIVKLLWWLFTYPQRPD